MSTLKLIKNELHLHPSVVDVQFEANAQNVKLFGSAFLMIPKNLEFPLYISLNYPARIEKRIHHQSQQSKVTEDEFVNNLLLLL